MRISVLVPGEEFLATAGARVRYQRIERHLGELGHKLDLQLIDEFKSRLKPSAGVVLISKCYDARGPMVSAAMWAQSLPVCAFLLF